MRRVAITAFATLAFLPAGCDNEPEEAPDITEAIPLDDVETVDEDEAQTVESNAPSDASDQGATWTGDPDTLERGDNSGQPPIDLENSKLQPAG